MNFVSQGAVFAVAMALTFIWCVVWVNSDCFSQCLWPSQANRVILRKSWPETEKLVSGFVLQNVCEFGINFSFWLICWRKGDDAHNKEQSTHGW